MQTANANFSVQVVDVPEANKKVELCVFDMPGQGIFREASLKLCADAAAVLVVFDASSEQSLENCSIWLDECSQRAGGRHMRGVLVANKCDITERIFPGARMRGQQFAEQYGLAYFETSAAYNDQAGKESSPMFECAKVEAVFEHIAKDFVQSYEDYCAKLENTL